MKVCPLCQERYVDDALGFCQRDGTRLAAEGAEAPAAAPSGRGAETGSRVGVSTRPIAVIASAESSGAASPAVQPDEVDLAPLADQQPETPPPEVIAALVSIDSGEDEAPAPPVPLDPPVGVPDDDVKFLLRAARRAWVPWVAAGAAFAAVAAVALMIWGGSKSESRVGAVQSAASRAPTSQGLAARAPGDAGPQQAAPRASPDAAPPEATSLAASTAASHDAGPSGDADADSARLVRADSGAAAGSVVPPPKALPRRQRRTRVRRVASTARRKRARARLSRSLKPKRARRSAKARAGRTIDPFAE